MKEKTIHWRNKSISYIKETWGDTLKLKCRRYIAEENAHTLREIGGNLKQKKINTFKGKEENIFEKKKLKIH